MSGSAQWAIPLGVLATAAVVLIYFGIPSRAVTYILGSSSTSTAPTTSASPSNTPSRTASPSRSATSPAASVSSIPPSTTPSTSPSQASGNATDQALYNDVLTDPTDVNTTTMLPIQWKDGSAVYTRASDAPEPCSSTFQDAEITDTLSEYGCTTEIVGTYLDPTDQLLVVTWVVPLPTKSDAASAYAAFQADGAADGASIWGIWCPDTGAGSGVCSGDWLDATAAAWMGYCHRYVIRAYAIYVNLRDDPSLENSLFAIGENATHAIGPQNIPGANCWQSTAVS